MREPAVLGRGFRVFFALGAGYAVLAPALWLAMLHGYRWPGGPDDPLAWHGHEMLFGVVGAAMAGFLLTAVPTFTGRPAVRGAALGWLALAWLIGRLAAAFPHGGWTALLEMLFPGLLAALIAVDVLAARNHRNLVLVAIVALWALAGAAYRALPVLGALAPHLVLLLITVIAGRIVPAFTGNWLRGHGGGPAPAVRPRLDLVVIVAVVLAGVADGLPAAGLPAAPFLAAAAALHALRLAGWRGHATFGEPLLWSLHLAYAWLVAGYTLLALAAWLGEPPRSAALHALTMGAMGSMMLAVMSRVVLGHTGRPLVAPRPMALAYLLVSLAAFLRVATGYLPAAHATLLEASGVAWMAAFALFVWRQGPMLLAPRVDGREG